MPEIRAEVVKPTQEKNATMGEQRKKDLESVTSQIIVDMNFVPENAIHKKKAEKYVKGILRARSRPEYTGKRTYVGDSLSKRIVRIEDANTRRFTTDDEIEFGIEVKKVHTYDDCIIRDMTMGFDHVYEVKCSLGGDKSDIELLANVINDPKDFFGKKNLGLLGSTVRRIIVKHASDAKDVDQLKSAVSTWLEGQKNVSVDFEAIPFTADQIVKVDSMTDKNLCLYQITSIESHKYLEIREITVDKAISKIVEGLPDGSDLRKLIQKDEKFISNYVYQAIKDHGAANMDSAVGYLFEAIVEIQKRSAEFNETINSIVLENRTSEATTIISGEFVDELNRAYLEYCSDRYISQGDGLILEERGGVFTVAGLIEIKTNPDPKLWSISEQLKKQVEEIKNFIEFWNKNHVQKLKIRNQRDLVVAVIKPQKLTKVGGEIYQTVDPEKVSIGESIAMVVRSTVNTKDLKVASKIFDEYTK